MGLLLHIFGHILGRLPLRLQVFLGNLLGYLGYLLLSSRRKITSHNLAKAFPDKSQEEIKRLTKAHFCHVGCVIIDLFSMPAMTSPALRKRKLRFHGLELLEELKIKKEGGMFLSAHMGSWESLCIAPTKGYDVYVLYKPASYFEDLVMSLRTACGLQLFPNDIEGLKSLLHRAYDGGMVAMLADQGRKGQTYDFFGYPARFPSGAAAFHVRHKLKAFPVFSIRGDDGCIHVKIHPPIDVDQNLSRPEKEKQFQEKYIKILEEEVRLAPEQYYWLHDVWRDFK